MNQPYFIVVLAHSLHGRIRRFHISQKVVIAVLCLALLGCFSLFGFVSSYLRMAWKVANYNTLRDETAALRERYKQLADEASQTNEQVARLQLFATEVSLAYGIDKKIESAEFASLDSLSSARLLPTLEQTIEQYNHLKTASLGGTSRYGSRRWLTNTKPALWPLVGRLLSFFGRREDPFHGHQSFHTGLDISAPVGTPVRAAADGVVVSAEWNGAYGKLIVLDHGKGIQTYYAHLSRMDVIPGQEVRMGQVIGGSGATGRVTSPHLHYEVRENGGPRNPYSFLAATASVTPSGPNQVFGF